MTELKSCPRCGNKEKSGLSFVRDTSKYAGYCKVCLLIGPFKKTKKEAIAAWNKRA